MFNYFNSIKYNFGQTGGTMDIMDIFKSIKINIDDASVVKRIELKDGERPDQLSKRLYNNYDYFWIPLILNKIANPLTDWPGNTNIMYIETDKAELVRNILRDSDKKNINIKISEL